MKIELEAPTWYSRESMYSSQVKSTDLSFKGALVDFSKENSDFLPSQDDIAAKRVDIVSELINQTVSWFTAPLTVAQMSKRLQIEFLKFDDYTPQNKWVQAIWVPTYFQVKRSGFVLALKIESLIECNPRIPTTFFESITPRATTPTEPVKVEVRNIVLVPGAGPNEMEQIDDIPLSETQASFEIKDERTRERQRLRQAKLRAAIARLKVEEMRERYLRHYGDELMNESSDSDDENSSFQSEFSEPVLKK